MNILSPEGMWGVTWFAESEGRDLKALPEAVHRTVYFFDTYEKAHDFAEKSLRADWSRQVFVFDLVTTEMCELHVSFKDIGDKVAKDAAPIKPKRRGRKLELESI